MKKVVLLGDSIRLIGYGTKVAELLGEGYEVWQPEENCRYSTYTMRLLFEYQKEIKGADVIHWNNGLWDAVDCLFGDGAFTNIDIYVENMKRMAKILLGYGKKVIFATTTPTGDRYNEISVLDKHNNERIKEYNDAVVPVLKEMGVIINDLHSIVSGHTDEYLLNDNLHLNEKGIDVCAKKVVAMIKDAI